MEHLAQLKKIVISVNSAVQIKEIMFSNSGQSKGELGRTEFPHLLFWAFVVPPPPIFSLCSSPTWIQLLKH